MVVFEVVAVLLACAVLPVMALIGIEALTGAATLPQWITQPLLARVTRRHRWAVADFTAVVGLLIALVAVIAGLSSSTAWVFFLGMAMTSVATIVMAGSRG